MNELLNALNEKYRTLIFSDFISFEEVSKMKNIMGVYMIHEGDKIIYIGKTNKFHVRFGTDLRHETTHTLVRKLIKSGRFEDRKEVKNHFINSCSIKIEICQSDREAEALEHIAIYLLNPLYNK